jgi:hypothetical protein
MQPVRGAVVQTSPSSATFDNVRLCVFAIDPVQRDPQQWWSIQLVSCMCQGLYVSHSTTHSKAYATTHTSTHAQTYPNAHSSTHATSHSSTYAAAHASTDV